MSTMDELRAYLGDDLGRGEPTDRTDRIRWVEVCVCGHLVTAHAPGIGGEHPLEEPRDVTASHKLFREIQAMDGCDGAMPNKSFERFTKSVETIDGALVSTIRINATCPCTQNRPVAAVDRPHRYFNQKRPADWKDPHKHPFMVGLRAYRTRIGKLKRAVAEGDEWADAEFDRRFQWLTGKRVCGISACTTTDDVWPVFVDTETGRVPERSELRCAQHR